MVASTKVSLARQAPICGALLYGNQPPNAFYAKKQEFLASWNVGIPREAFLFPLSHNSGTPFLLLLVQTVELGTPSRQGGLKLCFHSLAWLEQVMVGGTMAVRQKHARTSFQFERPAHGSICCKHPFSVFKYSPVKYFRHCFNTDYVFSP